MSSWRVTTEIPWLNKKASKTSLSAHGAMRSCRCCAMIRTYSGAGGRSSLGRCVAGRSEVVKYWLWSSWCARCAETKWSMQVLRVGGCIATPAMDVRMEGKSLRLKAKLQATATE